ncbi:MAG: YCF48-related protein [Syntrophomonadaceae bacterium]
MKTACLVLSACFFILVSAGTCTGEAMTQTSYRWRNDDGDVYSAKWKNSLNTPVTLTDNNNIRLRVECKTDDTLSTEISLSYREGHFNPWIKISRSDTGKFILSLSDFLSDGRAYSDNDLLPFDWPYKYQQTITFDSSESYYMNLKSDSLLYEFEYSIKPAGNIKPGSVYFFSIYRGSRVISHNQAAVLMTPPVSWFSQAFGSKYNSADYYISDISFVDANTGILVGNHDVDEFILRTTDGGETWTEPNYPVTSRGGLSAVSFASADVGIAVGGIVLRTTNGGRDWVRKLSESNATFNSVSFINADTGLVIGQEGEGSHIFKTVNGGEDWKQYYNPGTYLRSVQLIDANNGYVIDGTSGLALKTTDGGKSWRAMASENINYISDLFFTDVNNGYVARGGEIWRTTDGGSKWQLSFHNDLVEYLNSLHFINKNTGWATGSEGVIIKTTDGGINWIELPICTHHGLNSIKFIDDNTGWVWGYGMELFKTINGGIATSAGGEKQYNIPESFYLSQNYPNPFNPSTIIEYTLAKSGHVSLEIYDVLGRLVNTIVNKWQTEGDYKINWKAEDLPSGIYFYRIISGEYTEAKKMLLIR